MSIIIQLELLSLPLANKYDQALVVLQSALDIYSRLPVLDPTHSRDRDTDFVVSSGISG